MKKTKEKDEGFSHKEIAVFMGNAFQAASRPVGFLIDERRMAYVREYSAGIVGALSEDVPVLISYPELICALQGAALLLERLHGDPKAKEE